MSLIFDDYQVTEHSGLEGRTPNDEWLRLQSSVQNNSFQDGELELYTGSTHKGTIQSRQGIQINGLFYSSKELLTLRAYMIANYPRKNPTVSFRFNALDVSKIIVEVPSALTGQVGSSVLVVASSRDLEIGTALADVIKLSQFTAVQVPTTDPAGLAISAKNSLERIINTLENQPFKHPGTSTQSTTPAQAINKINETIKGMKALEESLSKNQGDEGPNVEPFEGDNHDF